MFAHCVANLKLSIVPLSKDIERMKRVRLHRGLRHYWGIRVRGQHTKTTGRHRAFAAMEASKGKK